MLTNMLTYPELKKIVTEHHGFDTIEKYRDFLNNVQHTPIAWGGRLTDENIELLSPDNINSYDFWKLCDDLFGCDPVCNTSVNNQADKLAADPNYGQTLNAMDSNRGNLHIIRMLGGLEFLNEFCFNPRVLNVEIGAGYGSLKNYIETHTKNQYVGYDLIVRTPGVKPTLPDGSFPPEVATLYGDVQNVITTNVFQHLSDLQREKYYLEARKLLRRGGLFILNSVFDTGNDPTMRHTNGRRYCFHYGQFTPVMQLNNTHKLIESMGFRMVYTCQRWDNVFNITYQKV